MNRNFGVKSKETDNGTLIKQIEKRISEDFARIIKDFAKKGPDSEGRSFQVLYQRAKVNPMILQPAAWALVTHFTEAESRDYPHYEPNHIVSGRGPMLPLGAVAKVGELTASDVYDRVYMIGYLPSFKNPKKMMYLANLAFPTTNNKNYSSALCATTSFADVVKSMDTLFLQKLAPQQFSGGYKPTTKKTGREPK